MPLADDLDYKAEQAIQAIDEAEFFEKAGDLENAISKYEEGAHLLSQSGFPDEKIAEIYDRIQQLKERYSQAKIQKAVSDSAAKDQAEKDAFALIDQAEESMKLGNIIEAIKCYKAAMPKLELAGYTTQHVEEKLAELRNKVPKPAPQKPAGRAVSMAGARTGSKPPVKPAGKAPSVKPAGMPPVKGVPAGAEQEIEEFKESRGKVEALEDKAFQLIDEAKEMMEQERYTDALNTFVMIKSLLANAGWDEEQMDPITVQENLVRELMEGRAEQGADEVEVESMAAGEPRAARQKLDLYLDQDAKMRQFRQSQQSRQDIEREAFDLIDQAQKLYKNVEVGKDYLGAIDLYEQAIALLGKANWRDQVTYLEAEVEKLKILHDREVQEKEIAEQETQRVAEEEEMKRLLASKKKQAVESDLQSISAMLGKIDSSKKLQQHEIEDESIKEKLIEERRYKTLVAKTGEQKSFDSIKEMLFGDKDKTVEAERVAKKQQMEHDFLSSSSKKFYDYRKAAKEAETPQMDSVEQIVDYVHAETVAKRAPKKAAAKAVDLREKQQLDVQREAQEKEAAVGDALSMLSSIKKDTKGKKEDKSKSTGIEDEELKNMFAKVKKK
jgi:tetratricopeptide (TPR) repeat protein